MKTHHIRETKIIKCTLKVGKSLCEPSNKFTRRENYCEPGPIDITAYFSFQSIIITH